MRVTMKEIPIPPGTHVIKALIPKEVVAFLRPAHHPADLACQPQDVLARLQADPGSVPQPALPRGPAGWVTSVGMALGHPPVYRSLGRILAPTPGDDLLEIGCGSAGLLAGPARVARHVAGIDLSQVQVNLARRRLARRIAQGRSFTAVVWLWGLETLVGDPHTALSEIRRVLRPEGRAVLTVGALVNQQSARGELTDLPGFWQWTQSRAEQEFTRAGFDPPAFHNIAVGGHLMSRINMATVGFDTIRVAVAHPAPSKLT